jgi:hypothetical protein
MLNTAAKKRAGQEGVDSEKIKASMGNKRVDREHQHVQRAEWGGGGKSRGSAAELRGL